ncbi:hypothetical protein QJS04_geneDACA009360 [Acorus gramineus]|uniref:Uncharacterized protein n=1 Tax=Acorus gramineus TaxID=55184 RepID=A0AAV9AHC2_ACOGR|nr:hypothetical protein QJS04_geneDACA009360 [Acorus gramineus]
MAAEVGGGGDDDMASLFEGMVLFDSSVISDDPSPPTPPPPVSHPSEPSPPSPSVHSKPLDENLFSDLTLIDPLQSIPLEPPPSSVESPRSSLGVDTPPSPSPPIVSTASISRQSSSLRKKKRAVRIGYAREDPIHSDSPSPSKSDLEVVLPMASKPEIDVPVSSKSYPEVVLPMASKPEIDVPVSSKSYPEVVLPMASKPEIDVPVSFKSDLPEEVDRLSVTEEVVIASGEANEREEVIGSIEEKLELIRARISEKLDRIRKIAASVFEERKETGRRRRRVAEELGAASASHVELERDLEEACEAEDFERAERVSEKLAAAEADKERLLSALRDAEVGCDAVEARMLEVLESQIAAEEEDVSLLDQFAKDAADDADLVLKNAEEVSLKEMEEWESSTEALEIRKVELDIQSHFINEVRSGLKSSIALLVADDMKEKEALCRKREVLNEELDELLALVRLKEAEVAENETRISAVEERIDSAGSEFQNAHSTIDMKCGELQSALSLIESEGEALALKKREVDEFLSLAEQKSHKLRELASVSSDEARTCQDLVGLRKSLVSSILKLREDKVRLAKMEEKFSEDIQVLRQQVSAARASLQELSSTKSSIQQEITSFKQRISFIDKRGPELEAEKKVAAAARNFKEAGRIAAEAKALSTEKENLQNKKEVATLELGRVEEEIKETVNKIEESENMILLKEREAAKTGFERLQLVAAAAMSERSAAVELGEIKEADALLKEAESAESEARKLQETYGLESDELTKAPEQYISIALVTNLAGKHLADLADSFHLS